MKRIIPGIMFTLLTVTVHAEDGIRFTTQLGFGWNILSFRLDNDQDVTARYATFNPGLTGQAGRFYGNLSAELFGADNQEKFNGTDNEITSVERQDTTFTFGFLPVQKMSIFAGYTVGEMKDDFNGNFHKDEGPFVGVGYNIIMDTSSLGFTLAYADLDGEIRTDGAVPGTDPIPAASGDTTGLSAGMTWSGSYRAETDYFVGIRVRRYDFAADYTSYDGDKNITAITAGLVF